MRPCAKAGLVSHGMLEVQHVTKQHHLPNRRYQRKAIEFFHTVPVVRDSTHSLVAECSEDVMWQTAWRIFGTADMRPRVMLGEVLACT